MGMKKLNWEMVSVCVQYFLPENGSFGDRQQAVFAHSECVHSYQQCIVIT
jgi:hypothetical protein